MIKYGPTHAIVRGIVEHDGDPCFYFGSLMAFTTHMRNAIEAGYVDAPNPAYAVTEKGMELYRQEIEGRGLKECRYAGW